MNRSKALIGVVVLIGAVVALEEWRLAGLRGRINQLVGELAAAVAAIPPPPRPVPPGAPPDETLRRSKARRVMARMQEAGVAAAVGDGAAAPVAADAPGDESGTPAVRAMNRSELVEAANTHYAGLLERFGLEGDEADYFINLMVDGMSIRQQLGLDLSSAKSDEERAGIQLRGEEAELKLAERVRTFLASDADFAAYQEFAGQRPGSGSDEAAGGGG